MAKTLGNVPPQALEVEKAVLGILMLEKNAFERVDSFIKPETFYNEKHQKIYEVIRFLKYNQREVDLLTVTQELRHRKELDMVGEAYYLTELTDNVVSTVRIEEYSFILNEKYLERELINICQSYAQNVFEGSHDVLELYDNISNDLFRKVSVSAGKQAVSFADIFRDRLKDYQKPTQEGMTGITSGFASVDELTNGWQPSDLIIIAARPGMGKTAFVLNLARNAAIEGGAGGAIFSLEMSKEQLVDRMVSAESEVYLEKIRQRNLSEMDWKMIHSKMTGLINSKIFIDDTAAIPIQVLRSKAIRLKHKHDIQWLVVDYLQLMRGDRENKGGNREQEISSISRGLKAIAKELDIPVIALSQLSRAVESRAGWSKRPMLSDLRESGAIEQDADQVVFLFRPEYYEIDEDDEGNSTEGICEVIFGKNRNGPAGHVAVRFNGAMMKFVDYEKEDFESPFGEGALKPNTSFGVGDEPF